MARNHTLTNDMTIVMFIVKVKTNIDLIRFLKKNYLNLLLRKLAFQCTIILQKYKVNKIIYFLYLLI